MMTALLCIATAGAGALSAAGQISGRWAAVLRALAAIDALGDITTYVGAAARLPAKAASHLRGKLGGHADIDTPDAPIQREWDDLDEPPDDLARASSGELENAQKGRRVVRKTSVEVHVRSDDGHLFQVDLRKLSPRTRFVISQLEKRGCVQLSEIPLADLSIISQWFGKEIAVVQTPYGKLRVILAEEDGVLMGTLREGETFLIHTHPVAVSKKGHFRIDLQNASENVEAVIDWNGNMTFYSSSGIRNPIDSSGVIGGAHGVRVAFLDANNNVRALAWVRASRAERALSVEVVR